MKLVQLLRKNKGVILALSISVILLSIFANKRLIIESFIGVDLPRHSRIIKTEEGFYSNLISSFFSQGSYFEWYMAMDSIALKESIQDLQMASPPVYNYSDTLSTEPRVLIFNKRSPIDIINETRFSFLHNGNTGDYLFIHCYKTESELIGKYSVSFSGE